MRVSNRVYWLAACLLLVACSPLKPAEPVRIYQLPATHNPSGGAGTLDLTLRVNRPSTSDALAGRRILVASADHRLSAWPGARWVSPVPQLWRDWLITRLLEDGRVAHVTGDGDGVQADLELGGMLRAFHSEVVDDGYRIRIRFDARLVETGSRRILASRSFSQHQISSGNDPGELVTAFGEAAERLGREVADWVVAEQNGEPDNS